MSACAATVLMRLKQTYVGLIHMLIFNYTNHLHYSNCYIITSLCRVTWAGSNQSVSTGLIAISSTVIFLSRGFWGREFRGRAVGFETGWWISLQGGGFQGRAVGSEGGWWVLRQGSGF